METKKCPMCAEQIPLDAAVCEFCGTILDESKAANKPREEPIVAPTPSAQTTPSPSSPASKKTSPWMGIAIGLGAILILALIGGGFLIAQNGLPFLATPTNTPRPTSTPRPTITPNFSATQQKHNADATATIQAFGFQTFAQPILNDVRNRQPNFEDDFSNLQGRFDRWNTILGEVEFTEGVIRLSDGAGAYGPMTASDFVLEYEFTPRIASNGTSVVVDFRWNDAGGYDFDFNVFHDNWWGLLAIPKNGNDVRVVIEGWSDEAALNRRTVAIIIAKDNYFAFYANGKPLAYVVDNSYDAAGAGFSVWSPNGPAEVDFDNVKFWDLNNLNP